MYKEKRQADGWQELSLSVDAEVVEKGGPVLRQIAQGKAVAGVVCATTKTSPGTEEAQDEATGLQDATTPQTVGTILSPELTDILRDSRIAIGAMLVKDIPLTEEEKGAIQDLDNKLAPGGKACVSGGPTGPLPGGHPGVVNTTALSRDILEDQKKLEALPTGYIKTIFTTSHGAVLVEDVKGVYKNCRGIWAAQWTDNSGQRHTKYFNPKNYKSEESARVSAFRFRIAVTASLEGVSTGGSESRGDIGTRSHVRKGRSKNRTRQYQNQTRNVNLPVQNAMAITKLKNPADVVKGSPKMVSHKIVSQVTTGEESQILADITAAVGEPRRSGRRGPAGETPLAAPYAKPERNSGAPETSENSTPWGGSGFEAAIGFESAGNQSHTFDFLFSDANADLQVEANDVFF